MSKLADDVLLLYRKNRDEFAAVMVKGQIIYHEDADKGHSQEFAAYAVASRLAHALGVGMIPVPIEVGELPEDWNFDDVAEIGRALTYGYRPAFPDRTMEKQEEE